MKKEQVLSAIFSGSNYISGVMLDNEGKSKCDYNMYTGKWEPYEVAWHTGQAIYALVESYEISKEKKFLQSAIKSGNWWVSLEIKNHPRLKGMINSIHGAEMGETIVYSTTTDGTAGLFRLSEVTGDKKYAKISTQAGIWLYNNMYDAESGLSYDCVDPVSGEVQKKRSRFWPDKKEQVLNDVARPNAEGSLFLDMHRFTGNELYKKWFTDQCDVLLRTQNELGLWMDFTPNDKKEKTLHPRFNLWYAEALLNGYELTGNKKYLDAALRTGQFFKKLQQKGGTMYYRNYIDGTSPSNESVTGSAVSFAGIIWIRLLKAGVGNEFLDHIETSAQWIIANRFAENHPDENLRGAFIESRMRDNKGARWMVNRDLGAIFGVRFLCDYFNYFYKNDKAK